MLGPATYKAVKLTEPAAASAVNFAEARDQILARVVGRERELELAFAAVSAGRDLLLEGPPGTSKTTMLKAITEEWGIPLFFVEGNADLTPTKLVGHHNPARVLQEDYSTDNFVAGPLLDAMREGGFLYVEEFNRAPEDTLNTLLTAMADRSITVPRVGRVDALPTFRVIASMNPYDNVGTTRLSTSVHDRLNRISVDYQDEESEVEIVRRRAQIEGDFEEDIAKDSVYVTRATRDHEFIRQGSSVRGAIDTALIAKQLASFREIASRNDEGYSEMFYDAMIVGLSARIHVDEAVTMTPEQVLREIWEDRFILDPRMAEPG